MKQMYARGLCILLMVSVFVVGIFALCCQAMIKADDWTSYPANRHIYTDGVLTVSRLANGVTKNSQGQTAIVACGDNIVWTLADGTTAEKIPMPDYADFGYAQIGFYASSTVGGPGLFYVVPVGFRSNWNGNLPVFSAPMLSAKCGFHNSSGIC